MNPTDFSSSVRRKASSAYFSVSRAFTPEALAALRAAEKAGWRKSWHYYRDFDPDLNAIRNEPESKAVFSDIERDMVRQRAELAARRAKAPSDPKTTSQ